MKATDAMLIQLLQRGDTKFIIPPYQRDYKWNYENVINLLNSLDFYNELDIDVKPSNYYLGNIILKEKNSNEWIVVDGQQRLTTISLIIRCIYYLLDSYESKIDGENLEDLKILKRDLRNALYIDDNGNDVHKFKIFFTQKNTLLVDSLKITNNFLDMIKKPKNLYQENLKIIYNWFIEKINERMLDVSTRKFKFLKNWYNQALNKIAIAKIELDAKDDECVVFETINTSAKPLEEHELIKNWLYMKAQNNINLEERLECAEFFTEVLEREFSTNNVVDEDKLKTFLALFAEFKEQKPFQTSTTKKQFYNSIYDWYKKNYKNVFSNNDKNEIINYLMFYKNIFSVDGVQENLFKFHHNSTYNTFYIINKNNFDYEKNEFIDKRLYNSTLLNLNRYYFIKLFSNIPFKGASTETSRIYEQLKNRIESSSSKYNFCDWELWENTFQNFENNKFLLPKVNLINKILLYKTQKIEKLKLLFWSIEKTRDKTFDTWEYFNNSSLVSAEHIFPQQWGNNEWADLVKNDILVSEFLHFSGNVIILEKKKNSQGSNDTLEKKIEIYKKSRFSTTREIVKYIESGWNIEAWEKINMYFLENIFNILELNKMN